MVGNSLINTIVSQTVVLPPLSAARTPGWSPHSAPSPVVARAGAAAGAAADEDGGGEGGAGGGAARGRGGPVAEGAAGAMGRRHPGAAAGVVALFWDLPPSLPACLPALRRRAGPAWPSRRGAARWGVGVAALAAQSRGRPERERRQGGRTCALSAATWRRKLVLQGHAAKGCSRWALGAERGGWRCSGWRCPAMGAAAVLPLAAKYGTLTALPSLARRTRTAMASWTTRSERIRCRPRLFRMPRLASPRLSTPRHVRAPETS